MCEGGVWEARPCASSEGLCPGREAVVGMQRALGRGLHPRGAAFLPWGTSAVLGVFELFFRRQIEPQFCQLWLDPVSAF